MTATRVERARVPPATAAIAWARRHRERFLAELAELIRFPSVSADPRRAGDVRGCADWLARHLRQLGLESVVLPTGGHPLVRAGWHGAPGRPTVLIYGHYDVQPVDPLAAWRSPPFEATRRGDGLHGRGASDDKGQLFAHLKALEAWRRATGTLPLNVVCLFDGEEEIGSPSLARALAEHRAAFEADVTIVSDTPMVGPGRPAVTHALRGMVSLEIRVEGPAHDLHSGTFGGIVPGAAQALCGALAALYDAGGRVAVPGFYDRVRPTTPHERARLRRTGPTDAEVRAQAGHQGGDGEPGYSLHERTTARPAVTVNGLAAGYAGPGPKAVIPARARAKLDVRLVPDQNPDEIAALVERHLAAAVPGTVRLVVDRYASVPPFAAAPDHPAMAAVVAACRTGFGTAPVLLRAGGSIPAVALLQAALGHTPLLLGFALPDDGAHAPNERLHLPTFWSAIDTSIALLAELAGEGGGTA